MGVTSSDPGRDRHTVPRAVVAVMVLVGAALAAVALAAEIVLARAAGSQGWPTVPAIVLSQAAFGWLLVGAAVAWLRSRHGLGWLFLAVGLLLQAGVAGETAGRGGWLAWEGTATAMVVDGFAGLSSLLLIGLLPLLYPQGRLRDRWSVLAATLVVGGALLMQLQWLRAQVDPTQTWAFGPGRTAGQLWQLWLPPAVFFAGVVIGWLLAGARLRSARYPERQQLAWLLVAIVALIITMLLGESTVAMALQAAALILLPVAVGIGVLRYRLLGIETVVPQAITYAVLTVLIAAAYLSASAMAGSRLTGAALPAVLASTVVAVVLLPLRDRLQRAVDRLLYGKRADPVGAVAGLGATLAGSADEDLMQAAVAEVMAAVGAEGAMLRDASGAVLASAGMPVDPPSLAVPLLAAGAPAGLLQLGPRRGARYTRTDQTMAQAMAGPLALAIHNLALANELQEQRDGIVEAARDERERLRRDLHDGLGPSLTGMRHALDALEDAITTEDSARTTHIAAVLRRESERSTVELRRIIENMRPAGLAHSTLPAALLDRLNVGASSATVDLQVAELPALPQDLEDAVYRVVTEAVTNAHKHADATTIGVHIDIDPTPQGRHLVARVIDNGHGLPRSHAEGVGLASMRTRATTLGGSLAIESGTCGTTVTLTVPVAESAA